MYFDQVENVHFDILEFDLPVISHFHQSVLLDLFPFCKTLLSNKNVWETPTIENIVWRNPILLKVLQIVSASVFKLRIRI
jgi:hypothetical protein